MTGRQWLFAALGQLRKDDRLLVMADGQVLARDSSLLWSPAGLAVVADCIDAIVLLDSHAHGRRLAATLGKADGAGHESQAAALGAEARSLRGMLLDGDDRQFQWAGRANQLLNWLRHARHCGRCGHANEPGPEPWAMVCASCGTRHFPRVDPAVIVLVHRGSEVLLARHRRRSANDFYSCLAGFVEVGETPEETVVREVREEVALEIAPPRYYGSQFWPFPAQLMLGFHAAYAGGEIRPQASEIEEAAWFPIDALPRVPSARVSVAGQLIEDHVARCRGAQPPAARPAVGQPPRSSGAKENKWNT